MFRKECTFRGSSSQGFPWVLLQNQTKDLLITIQNINNWQSYFTLFQTRKIQCIDQSLKYFSNNIKQLKNIFQILFIEHLQVMLNTQNPFQSTSLSTLSKFKSTADSIRSNRFNFGASTKQQQFQSMAKSIRKSSLFAHSNQNTVHLKQSRVSSKRSKYQSSSSNTFKQVSDFQPDFNIASKLAQTLRKQEETLINFKQWSQKEKTKIHTEFENLSCQIGNFFQKNKSQIIKNIDDLYMEMLQTYRQLNKIARNLYSQRNQYRIKSKTNIPTVSSCQYLSNYGLIQDLRSQEDIYAQYNQARKFYSENESVFAELSHKIQRINNVTNSDILHDLDIECELKQFQNYLYSSMKSVQQKLKWDKKMQNSYCQ